MSLILKGIDMPKKGTNITLTIKSDGTYKSIYDAEICGRAIQITKGHGDIKDVDELKSIKSIQSADFNSIETIQKWIDNAPTILEAESEE